MPTRFRSYTRVSLLAATLGGAVLLWSASSRGGTAAGGQGAAAAPAAASAGDAAAGRKIFLARSCATCHKADGSGGIKLTGNATPNWRDAKFMSTPAQSDSVLRDCITNGRPKSGMPAWVRTGQVKPEQVPDLIAYIRTFSARKK
jgi:mono/diheme cytochrome c family protein